MGAENFVNCDKRIMTGAKGRFMTRLEIKTEENVRRNRQVIRHREEVSMGILEIEKRAMKRNILKGTGY